MARRRRTRYQWLYNTGTIGPGANVEDTSSGRELTITTPVNATQSVSIVDLLLDTSSDEQPTTLPLGVYQNNDYVIKRIVGKCFVNFEAGGATANPAAIVTAGIFVARAGDADDVAGAENFPIGAAGLGAQAVDNYSPNRAETIREPWIWRRQWILGNPSIPAGVGGQNYPSTSAGYGSVADGPHIDAKTGRRVGSDERLFFVLSSRNYPVNIAGDAAIFIRCWLDYRVLGAMRRTKARSAF